MIEPTPFHITSEKPGAADWRPAGDDELIPTAINMFCEKDVFQSRVCITVGGTKVMADVFTDDTDMKDALDEYFKLNEAMQHLYGAEEASVAEYFIRILYLTNHGLRLDDEVLGSSGLPYEGMFDRDGTNFVAIGRKSIGTFKSMVIGAMSGVIAMNSELLPIHAAVVQAPNGNCVAFSGRGNMGKTTSLISTFDTLDEHGFKIVTDDWSMINGPKGQVLPVDYLISVRPESLPGLGQVYSAEWLADFTNRVVSVEKSKSKSTPLGIDDVFGANNIANGGSLRAVILTSVNKIYNYSDNAHIATNFAGLDAAEFIGIRMRDDAYHAPALNSKIRPGTAFEEGYVAMASDLAAAVVYTREIDSQRKAQAQRMSEWVVKNAL